MKKSNKILAVVLALVMMLTAVPMMTAGAADETEAPHTHVYVFQSETKATCTTDGERVFKCECGDVQKIVEEGSHTFTKWGADSKKIEKVDDNKHKKFCDVCDKFVESNHTWPEEIVAGEFVTINETATCEKEGKATVKCADGCEATKEVVVPKKDHTPVGEFVKDADKHTFKCDDCGKSFTVEHNFDKENPVAEKSEEATCGRDGYEVYKCTVCGQESEKVVIAKAHKYGEWENINDAKDHAKECKFCKAPVKEAHKFVAFASEKIDCKTPGKLHLECETCGYTTEEFDVTAEHDYSKYSQLLLNPSKHQVACANEGCTSTALENHTWDEGKVTLEATCYKEGTKEFKCVCGKTKTEKIDKVDHTWGEWKETKPATYTEEGSKERVCTVEGCTAKETEKIEKLKDIPGDVNGNGKVEAVDARMILQHVAKTRELSAAELSRADIVGNGDGVKATDARKVLQIVAGLA